MSKEVIIDMYNKNALYTVAMLNSISQTYNSDYINVLKPFVVQLLPVNKGDEVCKSYIKNGLDKEFGFPDFPIHTLSYILNRLVKEKILTKSKGSYYIYEVPDKDSFQKKKKEIQKSIYLVINELYQFLVNHKSKLEITELEDAEKAFISFLKTFGFNCLEETDSLYEIKIRQDRINAIIARFILKMREEKKYIFDHILNIAKGFIIYNAIYSFSDISEIEVPDFKTRFKDTVFYLDTPILIDVLNYDTEIGHEATKEMLNLIRAFGGKLATFECYVNEFRGILRKFALDPDSRQTITLYKLRVGNYSKEEVLLKETSLELDLKNNENKIEIHPFPEYGVVSSETIKNCNIEYIDWHNLREKLTNNYKLVKNKPPKEIPLENDIECISSICRIRGKGIITSFEKCKAIFITRNDVLLKTVKEVFHSEKSSNEIKLVMRDSDLTSYLWLKSPDKKSSLPEKLLIENAFSACYPNPDLIEKFIDIVKRMEKENAISHEHSLLLRSSPFLSDYLFEAVQDDPKIIKKSSVDIVKEKVLAEYNSLYEKEKKEKEELINIIKSKKINELKEANNNATNTAELLTNVLRISIKVLLFLLFLLICLFSILDYTENLKINVINIILLVFSFICNLLTFFDFFKIVSNVLERFYNVVFEHFLEKENNRVIKKYESIID